MSAYYWFSEPQFERIKRHFPRPDGVPRVGDRRVVSGIIHIIRNGVRWSAAPEIYGPHNATGETQTKINAPAPPSKYWKPNRRRTKNNHF